jgi:pSer/pThr/pTyr-binding forkhead associated (FHA) protein
MAKLVLSSGGTVLNQYFFDKERLRIGRAPDNDIVIDDPAVSREQAAIVTVGNDQIVEDLDSSNGTCLNGSPVSRQILQHRDVLEFGAFSLCYLHSKAAADIDFERTMLIAALPRPAEAGDGDPAIPAARRAGIRWPSARLQHLAGPEAGETVVLDRVVAVLGTAADGTVVVTRRPHGYTVTHVAGHQTATVNGQPLGQETRLLRPGDRLGIGGSQFEFLQDMP